MANLIRIQFNPNSVLNTRGEIRIFVKTGVSDYTYKEVVVSQITQSNAAFYIDFPNPPHAHVDGSDYTDFGIDIQAKIQSNRSINVIIDAINVVNTNLSPDTSGGTSAATSYMNVAMRTTSVEQLIASPTIINTTYIQGHGEYSSSDNGYRLGYNLTYAELANMPVKADPGRAWADPSILANYSISNSLTGCTTNNDTTNLPEGSSYSATITASSGYHFDPSNVSITMGGNALSPTFAGDYKSFTIYIPSVTSSVDISATATSDTPVSNYYTITNELTRCTTNNNASQIPEGSSYSAKLTSSAGYYFYTGNVVISMGSTIITPSLNKNGTYNVSIPQVTANVVITALASAEAPSPTAWRAEWVEIPTPNSPYDVVSSSIHQTADKIQLKVSAEDLVGTLNSQLTIESNLIHLYSDGKIVIEGENFNLDADGYITAVGAILENAKIQSERGSASNLYEVEITDGKILFSEGGNETAGIIYEIFDSRSSIHIQSNYSAYITSEDYAGIAAPSTQVGQWGGTLYIDAPNIQVNTSPDISSTAYVSLEFIDSTDPYSFDNCPIVDFDLEYDYSTGYAIGIDQGSITRTSFYGL